MSARLTVAQLVEALAVSYQTIDIRLGAMRENGTWINGITTLRLSRRSVEAVREHHRRLLERYGPVVTENFRVELMAMPFIEWPQFLKACSEGVLAIGDITVKWSQPPKIEAESGYIQRYQSDLRDQERWTWPSISQWCGGNRPNGLQNDNLIREVAASGWSSPHQAINALCEMNISLGSPYRHEIYFSIPVYGFIEKAVVSTVNNAVHLTYLQHSEIQGFKLIAFLKERNPNGMEVVQARVPLTLEKTASDDQVDIFSCQGQIETTNRERLVELKATHAVLGDIDSIQDPVWRLIPEVERNVLLAAVKRFCPEIESILVRPYEHKPKRLKESSAFELHTAWLLGLCGLSPIVLGEYERLLAEQTSLERASVDILAGMAKQSTLLVGACTMTTPKEEDFANLVHACEILRREVFPETSVRVVPVLFTGAMGQPLYKPVGDEFTIVPIVDTDRIAIVLELLEFGMERFFFDFLGNPQLCELRSPRDLPG